MNEVFLNTVGREMRRFAWRKVRSQGQEGEGLLRKVRSQGHDGEGLLRKVRSQ